MTRIISLICEFNPIHLGHEFVLREARSRVGADGVIICVMSGNFTERCTPAVFDKYTRARAALFCGADLVVELPFPYCASGVEDFARGGVRVAAGMGTDSLIFASESGDAGKLELAADIKGSAMFRERMIEAERTFPDIGNAVLFDSVIRELGIDIPLGANDKLGAEYMRFGRECGISNYEVLRRIEDMKSATALRNMIFGGCLNDVRRYIPSEAFEIYKAREDMICREERFFGLLFDYCRLWVREDVDNSILRYARNVAREAADPAEFIENLATKKYTAARMRREILFSMLGVSSSGVNGNGLHTVLLGANDIGRAYLAELRKAPSIPIITKPADDSALDEAAREAYRLQRSADELYCLCSGRRGGFFMRAHPALV